ncbi:hypothetical protein QJS66_09650 [Kocuria rhizophila]|nr:hypothetical protein QJS66_09650 [Kocuria rhizophila]
MDDGTLEYFREQGDERCRDNPPRRRRPRPPPDGRLPRGRGAASTLPEDGEEAAPRRAGAQCNSAGLPPEEKHGARTAASGRAVAMTGHGMTLPRPSSTRTWGSRLGNAAPATKAVSRLVLLDGQFSRLPSALGEGRKITAHPRSPNLFLTNGLCGHDGPRSGCWPGPSRPAASAPTTRRHPIPSFSCPRCSLTPRRYVPGTCAGPCTSRRPARRS